MHVRDIVLVAGARAVAGGVNVGAVGEDVRPGDFAAGSVVAVVVVTQAPFRAARHTFGDQCQSTGAGALHIDAGIAQNSCVAARP